MILPKLHFELEKWKFNKEFGIYVSTFGNIKSKSKLIQATAVVNSSGYMSVRIVNLETDNCQYVQLHRLVLLTFKPIDNYKEMTVDHLDSNRRNCKLKNLEWVTEEENKRRAMEKFIPSIEAKEKNLSKKKEVHGPFYIYDTYGNKYKTCIEAAIKTLKTYGFTTDELTVQQTASKIGECISHQNKYFGVFWYRRNEKGETKPVKK